MLHTYDLTMQNLMDLVALGRRIEEVSLEDVVKIYLAQRHDAILNETIPVDYAWPEGLGYIVVKLQHGDFVDDSSRIEKACKLIKDPAVGMRYLNVISKWCADRYRLDISIARRKELDNLIKYYRTQSGESGAEQARWLFVGQVAA